MNLPERRDAMGDFDRKQKEEYERGSEDFAKRMMIFGSLVIGLVAIIVLAFPSNDQIQSQKAAQFHLRDTWDCTHIQQDMVYRGWNTTRQDTSDPYFAYDLKLHEKEGCKP